jgi:uncharacterized membrane protein
MFRRRVLLTGLSLGATLTILMAKATFAADGHRGDGFGRHHRHDDMFVFLPVVLLIGFAIAAVVLWRRRAATAPPSPTSTFNAEAILAERLARGEINPDDYRKAIAVLRETPPSA